MQHLVLCALATFTVTFFIKEMDGPFDLFVWTRSLLMKFKFISALLDCFWCLSTWISFVITLVYQVTYGLDFLTSVLVWLGNIAIAGLIYKIVMF